MTTKKIKEQEVKTAKVRSPCTNCHFKGDGSGLVDQDTICPVCKGTGLV